MDALNMDDLTFNMASNIFPWTMKCSMFNVQCSMFNEPLLPPVGGRPGWGLKANSQSYNRYSYCLNNPLKYVDPSGYTNHPIWIQNDVSWDGFAWLNKTGSGGSYTAGSGNHWSDSQRGEYGNFMLMSGQTFVNSYGQDAYDDVFNNVVNPQNNTISIDPFNGAVYYLSLDNGDWTYVAFVDAEGNRVNLVETLEGAGNSINYFYLPIENGVDASSGGDGITGQDMLGLGLQTGNYMSALSDDARAAARGKYVHGNGKVYSRNFYGNQHVSKYSVSASKATSLKYAKVMSRASTGLTFLSAGVTVVDGLYGEDGWQNHHTADLLINGAIYGTALAVPVVGWIAGGVYFIADMTTQYYTGKSITENLFD